MSNFAPSPLHGAAYAVAIEHVGGISAIGDCSTAERYEDLRKKLAELRAWSKSEIAIIQSAYAWAIERVEADAAGRYDVHRNARAVSEALKGIPRPKP